MAPTGPAPAVADPAAGAHSHHLFWTALDALLWAGIGILVLVLADTTRRVIEYRRIRRWAATVRPEDVIGDRSS